MLLVSHNSNLSGAPLSLAQLARKLPDFGWRPLFLIPKPGPLEDLLAKWGIVCLKLKHPLDAAGFIGIVKRERPAVIHINSLVRTWPVVVSRLYGKPVVWHVREYLGNKRGYARLIHMLAHRVILISKDQHRLFNGMERAFYVPNAVDLKLFEGSIPAEIVPVEAKNRTIVTYIGSIEPRKGLLTLVEAAALLTEKRRIHYAIVGDAPPRHTGYMENILGIMREHGLQNRFHFLGMRTDVPDILASTDILCHPAIIEAFGRVVLEAMASKVPVIAAQTGEMPSIVDDGKTGLLFPPGDVKALAQAIDFLASSRAVRNRMGESGYAKVSTEYSIDLHAEKVARIYDGMKGNPNTGLYGDKGMFSHTNWKR